MPLAAIAKHHHLRLVGRRVAVPPFLFVLDVGLHRSLKAIGTRRLIGARVLASARRRTRGPCELPGFRQRHLTDATEVTPIYLRAAREAVRHAIAFRAER